MSSERLRQVARLYHSAQERQPGERSAYLAEVCHDEELRREVESLLQNDPFEQPVRDVASSPMADDTVAELSSGMQLGPYQVLGKLGAGGMGQVYLARDTRLERKVALKLLPQADSDSELVGRFEREGRSASALNHPNIAAVYDIGVASQGRFIVMEYVAGRTLRDMLKQGPLLDSLAELGGQMARALSAAHAAGITHRDIKPANLMVREDGYVKIVDFGLARLLRTEPTEETLYQSMAEPGRLVGTPRYMSPEQARGESPGPPSDMFSLGLVFYEMATGRSPFAAASVMETLHAIVTQDPERPSRWNPAIHSGLEQLILSMLRRDPSLRPSAAAVEAGLASIAAASSAPREANLPVQRTPFIGRDQERAAIRALLLNPAVRTLTLTGPGGTGKTRLALQCAQDLLANFPGGVYFVDLAPLAEPKLVISAIAKALNVRESPFGELAGLVREHLSSLEPALLMLENFEHLMDAASSVVDLLGASAKLKIMVTSRLVLRVYGEHEFPVPPLPLPANALGLAPERLLEFASVALFVQRASSVRPGFSLTAENASAVVEICRRLDGLPLAIELAAARVKLLPPVSLLARIESRLELLTGGARDRPERQQTLRRTIDWSYDLLEPAERKLFARLSVFAGGCTLEAAEAVSNTREDLELDLFDGIASLVDKSLLRQQGGDDEEPRFSMLETIREYARDRLKESGEQAATEQAHAAYFLVVAEEDVGALHPDQRQAWYRRSDLEHDNFRAAIRSLLSSGNAEWALRLGAALLWFWEQQEYFTEGHDVLETILCMPGAQARTVLRARLAFTAGVLGYRLGDTACSDRWHSEALGIFRELNDRQGIATSLNAMAMGSMFDKRFEEGKEMLEEGLLLWRQAGDDAAADHTLSNLALIAKNQGDYEGARATFQQLAVRFRGRGNLWAAAGALSSLGDVVAAQKDHLLAKSHYEESLALFRQLHDSAGAARVLADLGNLTRDHGDHEAACLFYLESLGEAVKVGRRSSIARTLADMAWCAVCQARHTRALKLAGAAAVIRRTVGTGGETGDQSTIQRILEATASHLPGPEHAQAWAAGQQLALDQAVQYAFADID